MNFGKRLDKRHKLTFSLADYKSKSENALKFKVFSRFTRIKKTRNFKVT